MSAGLARIIGRPKDEVSKLVAEMEEKYGNPAHDVRMLSEVIALAKQKIAELKLDPNDTTAKELYYSLQNKYRNDCSLVDESLGIGPNDSFDQRLGRAIEIVKAVIKEDTWSLKPSAAKELLRQCPPKKLIKQLGYRTVESILKRENVGGLYLLAPFVESASWQKNFQRTASRVSSSSYIVSQLNFIELPEAKLDGIGEPPNIYVCNRQTASLAVWPSKKLTSAPVITLALLLAKAAQELGIKVPKKALLSIHPSLSWWSGIPHVISNHDTPISFNIHDVALNHHNDLAHHESLASEAAKSLWSQLEARYENLQFTAHNTAKELTNIVPGRLAEEFQEAIP